MTRRARPQPTANSVLAALPPRTYRALLSGLEPVTLAFGEGTRVRSPPARTTMGHFVCALANLTAPRSVRWRTKEWRPSAEARLNAKPLECTVSNRIDR